MWRPALAGLANYVASGFSRTCEKAALILRHRHAPERNRNAGGDAGPAHPRIERRHEALGVEAQGQTPQEALLEPGAEEHHDRRDHLDVRGHVIADGSAVVSRVADVVRRREVVSAHAAVGQEDVGPALAGPDE